MDHALDQCPDRLRLAEAVSRAAEAVAAVSAGDRYRLDYLTTLAEAFNVQREAERALRVHRMAHGC